MRIISKFKDYYDGAMGLGMDTSVLFMRQKPEIIGASGRPDSPNIPTEYRSICPNLHIETYQTDNFLVKFWPVSIYFCGKVYRGIRVIVESGGFASRSKAYDKTFYSLGSFQAFMEFHDLNVINHRHTYGRSWQSEPNIFKRDSVVKSLENFFHRQYDDRDFTGQRIQAKTIIAVYGLEPFMWGRVEHYVTINPKLSDYEFYRVHPAPQAYQEIEMYISGVLGEANKEPINISDKDRIYQHGFNERSFRKDPDPSKKRNRTRA
jgi:hypothetical protein